MCVSYFYKAHNNRTIEMFNALYQYIQPFANFTGSEKLLLESAFVFRQVPKKFRLAEEGKTARELYFIVKGLVRLYYTKEGKKSPVIFSRKGCLPAVTKVFCASRRAFRRLKQWKSATCLSSASTGCSSCMMKCPKCTSWRAKWQSNASSMRR